MFARIALAAAVLLSCFSVNPTAAAETDSAQDPVSIRIAQFATAPSLDGDLSDPCWARAERVPLSHVPLKADHAVASTEARFGVDARWLYIAFTCHAPGGNSIFVSDQWWKDERVEVFVDNPERTNPWDYFWLRYSVNGERRDYHAVGPSTLTHDGSWTVTWPAASRIGPEGWTAELAIPLYLLGRSRPEKGLRLNVVRLNVGSTRQTQSWAPVNGKLQSTGIHDPEHFGVLTGWGTEPVLAECDPVVTLASDVSLYKRNKDGSFAYSFSMTLHNRGGRGGAMDFVVEDQAPDGSVSRSISSVDVPPEGQTQVRIRVPVSMPGKRTARVAPAWQVEHPWAQWQQVAGTDRLLTLTAYPDLSRYWGEAGRLFIGTAFPDKDFEARQLKLSVRITSEDGSAVLEKTFRTTANQGRIVPFPANEWNTGTYRTAVDIRAATGASIERKNCTIHVVPPPPDDIQTSRVDHENMCLLVNDQPLLPFGFMCKADFQSRDRGRDIMEKFHDGGMNCVVEWRQTVMSRRQRRRPGGWGEAEEDLLRDTLDARTADYRHAHQAGVPVIADFYRYISWPVSHPDVVKRDRARVSEHLPRVIEALKAHPGIIAWVGMDEMHDHPAVRAAALEHAEILRRHDPYHVTYATARGSHSWMYDIYDVMGVHAYWSPMGSGPNKLASWVNGLYATAKLNRVPAFATVQGQRLHYERGLSPEERRCGIYVPVIQGAKGIMIFIYRGAQSPINDVNYRVFSYTARELQHLAPILLKPRPPQNIQFTAVRAETAQAVEAPPLPPPRTLFAPSYESTRGPGQHSMPQVQAMVHDTPGGGELIIVANTGRSPARVRFALSSLGKHSRVRTYFSHEEVETRDGRFTIDFTPRKVHILETLNSVREPGAPVSLGMQADPLIDSISEGENLITHGDFEAAGALDAWDTVGDVTVSRDQAFEGQASLHLVCGEDDSRSVLAQQKVTLKPRTRYRARLRARCTIEKEGKIGPSFAVLAPLDSISGDRHLTPIQEPVERKWTEYTTEFITQETTVGTEMRAMLHVTTKGSVFVDAIELLEYTTDPRTIEVTDKRVNFLGYKNKVLGDAIYNPVHDLEQIVKSGTPAPGENILRNSSFEECTIPGMTDHWSSWQYLSWYRGDSDTAYHGQRSMLLTVPCTHRNVEYKFWTSWAYDTTYTFSAWIKADRPGLAFRVGLRSHRKHHPTDREPLHKDVDDVPTDWQRVTWTFRIPETEIETDTHRLGKVKRSYKTGPVLLDLWNVKTGEQKQGKIWVDAVQLELGNTASAYKPDPYRAPPFNPKWASDEVFKELER